LEETPKEDKEAQGKVENPSSDGTATGPYHMNCLEQSSRLLTSLNDPTRHLTGLEKLARRLHARSELREIRRDEQLRVFDCHPPFVYIHA
jgi:hypothetical protein